MRLSHWLHDGRQKKEDNTFKGSRVNRTTLSTLKENLLLTSGKESEPHPPQPESPILEVHDFMAGGDEMVTISKAM